jgi:hypothetical protein
MRAEALFARLRAAKEVAWWRDNEHRGRAAIFCRGGAEAAIGLRPCTDRPNDDGFMTMDLPHKGFVSHSYRDEQARAALLAGLPETIEPFVFPPIKVTPDQMVSNDLIRAVLDCDGLIYLEGGHSGSSFWVAMERDFALRAGKPVFAYDPASDTLRRDTSTPLRLPVFASYAPGDRPAVIQVARVMREERFFDLFLDLPSLKADWQAQLDRALDDRLEQGGYLVLFVSREALHSRYVESEVERGVRFQSPDGNLRVVPVWLGDPAEFISLGKGLGVLRPGGGMLPPGWPGEHHYAPVMLRQKQDPTKIDLNRVDDLIVRLYWLIYQNTHQRELV